MEKMIVTKEELKRMLTPTEDDCEAVVEGFILLTGNARSSKRISSCGEGCFAYNEIDDTEEEFASFDEMLKNTNIGKALEKKAFIVEDYYEE